jgi:hypothetical protein
MQSVGARCGLGLMHRWSDSVSDNGDESAITVSMAEFKTRACQNM